MPKTTKKQETKEKKPTVTNNTDDIKKSVKESAEKIGEEGKRALGKLESRWKNSNTGEKVSVIVGIIFLAIALGMLWEIIWGMVFLVIGVLGVTCFFVEKDSKK